jgi:hypothetical protein
MQNEFPIDRIRAQVGQKVDATQAVVLSAVADVKIPFGALLLYDDTDDRLCKVPVPKAPLDKPLGISLRHLHGQDYEPKTSIAVMRTGRIWVLAEKVVAAGDAVYIKFAEDGAAKFTSDKKDNLLLKGAIFLEKSEGGLVPIEVNFFGGVQ